MTILSEKALEMMAAEVGEQEVPKGSNWGPAVQKYLASVGINFPAAWCMACVYWCFSESAKRTGLTNTLYKTGGVQKQWNMRRVVHQKNTPQPGDVFIMLFGKGLGHTGMVERVEGDYIHTIEGNSNDEGSREGYEVCRNKRKISSITGFLRF